MSMEARIAEEVRRAVRSATGLELDGVHVERPNDPGHGDYATNVALAHARTFRRNPREVAGEIAGALDAAFVEKVEVAGPGFINFWLSAGALAGELTVLLRSGEAYGRREPSGKPVNLEFVSANPTGPLHVGHGRHAAYGDSLARILAAAGRKVSREFYFNDGGNQIRLLGESVAARYAELYGREWPVSDPDALYKGEYIAEIARTAADRAGERYLEMEPAAAVRELSEFAADWCMRDIRRTLKRARTPFDIFFNERSLYDSGEVERVVERLREGGYTYERDGALWLRSTDFGDDKDRVLVKSDGGYTYMAPDLAYHLNKWERGFARAVDIWGADHAGYPPRIRAGLLALGLPEDFFDVEIVRLVKLMREGRQVKASKRAGNFVTFDELLDEVGVDVARYFFVRSSHRTEMNFDLDLAVRQSDENPVYYVQYAHARIASIFRRAGLGPEEIREVPEGEFAPEERLLVLELLDYPRILESAAARREVHPVPIYLEALATKFHQFYTVHRVLVGDEALQRRRLALCAATKTVLKSGLELLGVEAPERM
ncbi:arginine--tRNA ligase [Rubrobacter taiwanensis]|uniref:Arginine--tRNA ligase n=1 Tax=Rubrobacter taiwanensis TaxID=185139 RepID=A0A4R1BP29_9ACTN|nr:arginine--tRNA ligase [Rubrobacter taiwanensis]TCJ19400.1 arginine--tRNA ligase [Rubrobacter taiwanensis]